MTSINRVLLVGRVTEAGPKLTYSPGGSPQCTFTLLLEDPGPDGKRYKLFVPVDVFGKQAEPVAEQINVGDVVLVDGKLKWKSWLDQQGVKQGKLVVLAWAVSLVGVPSHAVSTN
jgi:single stranded DNA-binding protein